MNRSVAASTVAIASLAGVIIVGWIGINYTKTHRTISAVGSATVLGAPDAVRMYLEVETTGKTLAPTRKENASIVNNIRAALAALKLPDLKSKTRDVDVSQIHAERSEGSLIGPERPSTVIGYRITYSFSVLIQDPDPEALSIAAGRVLDTAMENGVTDVDRISFFKSDEAEMRRQARTEAVENAIANARAYADGANVEVTDVVEISGDSSSPYGGRAQQGMQGLGGGGGGSPGVQTSFITGEWEVTSHVRIKCHY